MPRLHKRANSRTCLYEMAPQELAAQDKDSFAMPPAPATIPGADVESPRASDAHARSYVPRVPLCSCMMRRSTSTIQPLLDVQDISKWRRLPYILSGYRPEMTHRQALATALTVHNQTGNIVTHLVPAVLFVVGGPAVAILYGGEAYFRDGYDVAVFAVFYLAVSFMLVASTLYHVFECVSERVHNAYFSCDLCGIAICVLSLCYLHVWHSFRFGIGGAHWAKERACTQLESGAYHASSITSALVDAEAFVHTRPKLGEVHALLNASFKPVMALLCTLSTCAMTYISAHPAQYFLRPNTLLKGFYGMTFTCYTLVTTHLLATIAYANVGSDGSMSLGWPARFDPDFVLAIGAILSLAFITIGCNIFNAKWPEILAPGLFDLVGNSHQLWHIACTIAPMFMFAGSIASARVLDQVTCT
ncbi:hypothetical protein NFJ02_06g127060 [Pycnococcus provasolii]